MSECLEYASPDCGPWGAEAFAQQRWRGRPSRAVVAGLLIILLLASVALAVSLWNTAESRALSTGRALVDSSNTFDQADLYYLILEENSAPATGRTAAEDRSASDQEDLYYLSIEANSAPATGRVVADDRSASDQEDLYYLTVEENSARPVPSTAKPSSRAESDFSGDDAYDPAADARFNDPTPQTFGGDDAYDPAASGLPQ